MMTQAMVDFTFGGLGGRGAPRRARGWRERRQGPYLRRKARLAAAPGNTTQFLMGDQAVARTNFSDSDLDNSSENDEQFREREFAKDYDSLKPIRQKLTKSKLIEELMTVEKDVKMLEKKYAEMTAEEQLQARLGTVERGCKADPKLDEKIRIFQDEIVRMAKENLSLKTENTRLINEKRAEEVSSSSSSGSDSSSSDSDSDSSSDEEETEAVVTTTKAEDWQRDDTGYESDRSDCVTTTGRHDQP